MKALKAQFYPLTGELFETSMVSHPHCEFQFPVLDPFKLGPYESVEELVQAAQLVPPLNVRRFMLSHVDVDGVLIYREEREKS